MKRKDNTEKTKETYITSNFNISYNVLRIYKIRLNENFKL